MLSKPKVVDLYLDAVMANKRTKEEVEEFARGQDRFKDLSDNDIKDVVENIALNYGTKTIYEESCGSRTWIEAES